MLLEVGSQGSCSVPVDISMQIGARTREYRMKDDRQVE